MCGCSGATELIDRSQRETVVCRFEIPRAERETFHFPRRLVAHKFNDAVMTILTIAVAFFQNQPVPV